MKRPLANPAEEIIAVKWVCLSELESIPKFVEKEQLIQILRDTEKGISFSILSLRPQILQKLSLPQSCARRTTRGLQAPLPSVAPTKTAVTDWFPDTKITDSLTHARPLLQPLNVIRHGQKGLDRITNSLLIEG